MIGLLFGFGFWVIIWLLCAVAADMIATMKGRSGCIFSLLGLMLGPIGVIVAASMPANEDVLTERGIRQGVLRECPYCAEAVKYEAAVCRYCANPLPAPEEVRTWWDRLMDNFFGI